ncbi:MAG: bifunctional demethylmenaquinone methyltransferase/2-methoxy-6-polyprenyl-1,4-benzoquinol methylase UbiE [Phycisphaerales bacterium JB043]
MPETSGTTEPAWTSEELAGDPHEREDKPRRVRRMFGAIAGSYDLNNRLHSFGRDQAWRRRAVALSDVDPGSRVLDVACGTGDLTRAYSHAGASSVTGCDFTPEMLAIARRKTREPIEYIEADAMALPFEDASFDVVSIAFGIRNVGDSDTALREFARVLAPGGRLVVLEFSEPRNALLRWLNRVYCHRVMPVTATLIARDRSGAYRYLPRSVSTFLDREEIRGAMERAGVGDVRQHPMTFGVCVCSVGVRRS